MMQPIKGVMRQWINLIVEQQLDEYLIPPTGYGYWITSEGVFLPVSFQNHYEVAEREGKSHMGALGVGWIRIVCTNKTQVEINFLFGRTGSKAISALRKFLLREDFISHSIEVESPSVLRVERRVSNTMQFIQDTSSRAAKNYTFEDWKWLKSGAIGENPSRQLMMQKLS